MRMADAVREDLAGSPELQDLGFGEGTSRSLGTRSVGESLAELYSLAQPHMLARCHGLLGVQRWPRAAMSHLASAGVIDPAGGASGTGSS